MKLDKDEMIESWDVVATTTKGRKIAGVDLRFQFSHKTTQEIDELFEVGFPCTWLDED